MLCFLLIAYGWCEKLERIEFLPLGSVVLLNGNPSELLIIGRGLKLRVEDKDVFADYAGVKYPEGLVSDKVAYFDHNSIVNVLFRGFSDERDSIIVDNINNFVKDNNIKRMPKD